MKPLIIIFLATLFLTACSEQNVKRDGKAIYFQSCVSCHDRGHGGAPVRGDKKAWKERLVKGQDVLLENLKNGYKTMPPKGACFDCSDKELKQVLEFILLDANIN